MVKKGYGLAAFATVASLVLAACGGASTPTPVVVTRAVTPVPREVVVTPTPTAEPVFSFTSKDPTHFIQVQAIEPDTLDPVITADRGSAAILQNVYDTLVFYKRDSVTEFVPQLAEEVPSIQNGGISPDGRTYTFRIRQGVKFHNGDDLRPSDVAYTFQRAILSGGSSSLQWLVFEPILGTTENNDITDLIDPYGTLLNNPDKLAKVNPTGLQAMCRRVQNIISADNEKGTVTFRLVQSWGPFLMILAGPHASIQDQQWVAANGGWDGSCATWQNYYDRTVDQQNETPLGRSANGTGPYLLDHWTPEQEIVLKANPNYWRKEPAWEGGPAGIPAIQTVTIQIIKGFNGRVKAFKAGEADAMGFYLSGKATPLDELSGEICSAGEACTPGQAPGSTIRTYMGLPASTRMDAIFNFEITSYGGNPLIGSGQLDGSGIPGNFFTDVHIRQAFSACFNWDAYIEQAMEGQGQQVFQPMLPGQLGANLDNPHYSFDPEACAAAFQASAWKGIDGRSLWDTGFQMTLVYNPNWPESQTAAEILSENIAAVNEKFVVQVSNVTWEAYQDYYRNKKMPIYFGTSRGVIADPHYWASILTVGTLGRGMARIPMGMRYQFANLVTRGVQSTDPAAREQIYLKFNQTFYQNAPAILLAQELVRRYEQRWVKGYYYNPMYADLYYYALSKE